MSWQMFANIHTCCDVFMHTKSTNLAEYLSRAQSILPTRYCVHNRFANHTDERQSRASCDGWVMLITIWQVHDICNTTLIMKTLIFTKYETYYSWQNLTQHMFEKKTIFCKRWVSYYRGFHNVNFSILIQIKDNIVTTFVCEPSGIVKRNTGCYFH